MGQTYTHMTDRQTDRQREPITLPLAPACRVNMQQWVRVATPTDDVIVLVRGIVSGHHNHILNRQHIILSLFWCGHMS